MEEQGSGIREQGTGSRKQEVGSSGRRIAYAALVLAALVMVSVRFSAQQIQLGDASAAAKKQHVSLATDVVETEAGSVQVVQLRFRVDEGFHINSHTPKDELLVPTSLKLDDGAGVKVLAEEYPVGSAFTIGSGSASENLDVYQGEFRVRVRIVVPRGDSTLIGALQYQACDNTACFPPRTLPLRIAVHGK